MELKSIIEGLKHCNDFFATLLWTRMHKLRQNSTYSLKLLTVRNASYTCWRMSTRVLLTTEIMWDTSCYIWFTWHGALERIVGQYVNQTNAHIVLFFYKRLHWVPPKVTMLNQRSRQFASNGLLEEEKVAAQHRNTGMIGWGQEGCEGRHRVEAGSHSWSLMSVWST